MRETGGAEHVGKLLEAMVLCPAHWDRGMLLLQHEGDLHIDLVANDVAVLDQDVLILHPRALYAPERLGSSGYSLVDSILKARL